MKKKTPVGRFSRVRRDNSGQTECGARILASVGCDRQGLKTLGTGFSGVKIMGLEKWREVPKPQPCSNGKVYRGCG